MYPYVLSACIRMSYATPIISWVYWTVNESRAKVRRSRRSFAGEDDAAVAVVVAMVGSTGVDFTKTSLFTQKRQRRCKIFMFLFFIYGRVSRPLSTLPPSAGNVARPRLASVSRNWRKKFCVQNSTPYIERCTGYLFESIARALRLGETPLDFPRLS
jgi:hypothetical protein